ncbi:MAG: DUF2341 domain-containing protein [Candidatus Sifarchaeia archaeon]
MKIKTLINLLKIRKLFFWFTVTRRRKILSLTLIALITLIPLRFIFSNREAEAAWWNNSWLYRKKINISNSTGGTLTNYQVQISLDTSTLIADGKLESSCEDIRIVSDETALSYWIEESGDYVCNTSSTYIWTKIPSLPTTGITIYIYYGNSWAADASDGDNVFEFFDDFSTDTLGSKWTGDTGDFSISSGLLNGATNNNDRIQSNVSFTGDYEVITRSNTTSSATNGFEMAGFYASSSNSHGILNHNGTWYTRNDSSYPSQGSFTFTQWVRATNKVIGTAGSATLTGETSGTDSASNTNSGISSEYVALGTRYDDSVYNQAYDNDWDWLFVKQAVTTEPTASISDVEEESPGRPVAHWKFDEGYNKTIEKPLTNLEQQLTILEGVHYHTGDTTYYPTDNSLGLVHWDEDKYTGATVYLEAVMYIDENDFGANSAQVQLYEAGGGLVSGSLASTTSEGGVYARVRSSAITLTDDTDYTVRIRPTTWGRTAYIKSARLIVIQSDSAKITNTSTQVEVGAFEKQVSNTATQLTDKKIYYYDDSKFSPAPTAYFEASLRNSQPTIEQQITILNKVYSHTGDTTYSPADKSLGLIRWDEDKYTGATVYLEAVMYIDENDFDNTSAQVQLYEAGGGLVSGSLASTTSEGGVYDRVRSSAITLTDDTDYTIRIRTTTSGRTAYIKMAKLIIIQSDSTKITNTRTHIDIGDNQASFTNTSYASLGNPKYYKYDQDQFTPNPTSTTGDISFHASLKIDDSGDSVYAQLWNISGTPAQVAELSHNGDTEWTLKTVADVDSDSDWDQSNDDQYEVRIRCNDDNGGGCIGNIANATLLIDQTDSSGITNLEIAHQQVNTLSTDTDETYSSKTFYSTFNPDLETSQRSFAGGTFNYYYEATLKTSTDATTTAYAQLYNSTDASAYGNSEVSTTSDSYSLQRSGDISSDLPQYPQQTEVTSRTKDLDTQIKNSEASGDTSSVSNSWLIIDVSNLATSGVTAYADLYNFTDSTQVSGSEVSTTSTTWTNGFTRSSAITLTTGKEYVVRLKSSVNNVAIHAQNAKIILDQSDTGNGITETETVQQMINAPSTDGDTGYTDQDFLNSFDPSNNGYIQNYNDVEVHFETTMKSSSGGGSDDAMAILTVDGGSTVTGSDLETSDTNYDRVRTASSIASNMPSSTSDMDTQLKNESGSATTTASNSWMIIQNNNTLSSGTSDSTGSGNDVNINGASWETECKNNNCLDFDGTDDYALAADNSTLDFAATDDFTITGWFKHIEQTSGTDTIIAKYETSGSDGGYKVYMESDGDITFGVDDDNTWSPDDAATSTNADYDDNSWHHFAAVKDDTTSISLYIDGQLVNTDDNIAATGSLANDDNVYIGIDGDGSTNAFNGLLDEIKIYPYARSQAEINTDFIQGAGEHGSSAVFGTKDDSNLYDGLVGYWDFEEATGSATVDRSGNGNDGTLTNMQETGIADSGGSTTTLIDTDGSLSSNDDAYNGMIVEITDGSCGISSGTSQTITDYTGSSNTITVGTAWGSAPDDCGYIIKHQVGGKFGRAIAFDTSNDFVDAGSADSLDDLAPLTYSAWLYPATGTSSQAVVINKSSNKEFSTNATTALRFRLGTDEGAKSKTTDSVLTLDTWNFVTATWDGTLNNSGTKIYVNGVEATYSASGLNGTGTVVTEASANQRFGARNTDSFDMLGKMDEIRIYNRILSPSEVQQLYRWAPGPVGYWKMDEGSWSGNGAVNDYSGNLNALTHKGNASIISPGKYGNGSSLDGSGDYLCSDANTDGTCDDDGGLDVESGSFSIEGWFKHTTIATNPDYLVVKAQAGTNAGYKVYMASDGDIVFEIDDDSTWDPDYSVTTTAATYDDEVWHHFAAVRDSDSEITISLDGVQIATNSIASTATLSNDDVFYIGIDDDGSSNPWDGQLDDLKIYNYARTPEQIVEDMNAGHPAPGSPVGSAVLRASCPRLPCWISCTASQIRRRLR